MLFAKVKSEMMAARRAKDTKTLSILSTFVGELSSNAKMVNGEKTVPDEDVVALCKKFIKGIDEVLAQSPGNETAAFEKSVLSQFMPQQMSESELSNLISEIIADGAGNMGMVMKELKSRRDGQYDGKLASQLTKTLLQ